MANELKVIECKQCNGTGKNLHKHIKGFSQQDYCTWCSGKGSHQNVPYPMFCMHPSKCAGFSCCPRNYSCCD
jgi:DnaJ-class molecular chaperone